MLLTITTTHNPATDLGYLLYKNPAQLQTFDLSFGKAHVFYPQASNDRCTAALLVDIDPIDLVRGRKGSSGDNHALEQYVNDRPYAASSFLSVAIAEVFGTALNGKSRERQELADSKLPLEAEIPCLPCRSGEQLLRRLFEPLGYNVDTKSHQLDSHFKEWGESRYLTVQLTNTCRLRDLLSHLYVLVPVLDDDKHYWVGDAEIDKLLRHGKTWLPSHPEKELITTRYLLHRRKLTRLALDRLSDEDDSDPDATEVSHAREEAQLEERISLNEQRIGSVLSVLKKTQAKTIIDLGCGEGKLLKALLEHREIEKLVGVDVSFSSLEIAKRSLHFDQMPERQKARISLMQGSLTYKDNRMSGFDAATCIEVIEHMDQPRLIAFERVVFEFARPKVVIVTTPNSEYNCKFATLPAGKFRHKDHRFEWTRQEFHTWADGVASRYGYSVDYLPVGQDDAEVGPPTQMGVFVL